MSDFDNKLNAYFAKLDDKLQKHFPNMLAETATELFKENFKNKSFFGEPWQPYKNKAREPSRGSLMMRTNALFGSVRPSTVTAMLVIISAGNSRVPYARIHNEGGRIAGNRNIRAYTNRNFMGKGKAVNIRAHTRKVDYTMPKRQFMGKHITLLNTIKTRFKTL
jgi:phage gpG-like protein